MARKEFTEEEKQNYIEKQKELTTEIFNKLEVGVQNTYSSERYRNYLEAMSKFHNYSFRNVMLILMQKPEASLCAGINTWNKNNRSVNKGEKGLTILAPVRKTIESVDEKTGEKEKEKVLVGFKLTKTFDISQTNGKPLPTICKELKGTVDEKEKIIRALESVTKIKFQFKSDTGSAKGYYSPINNEVVIKSGMDDLQTIKTAIHESTHALLHHIGAENENAEKNIKEIQAESVAFVVSAAIGLDTSDYSFDYVASWSNGKDVKELENNFDIIQKTSEKFISAINKEIKLSRTNADLEMSIKEKGLKR